MTGLANVGTGNMGGVLPSGKGAVVTTKTIIADCGVVHGCT